MIRYEQWPIRAQGGQVVGTGPNGVKGVHWIGDFETGIVAACDVHRSQHKNREVVREMIHWALSASQIEIGEDD